MLTLVEDLLNDWHQHQVRYCHWKSNEAIERGLSGNGDLDILVSQFDTDRVYQSLTELGFKRLIEPAGSIYPGIEHWLGMSEKEGKFAHIHLHFRLVYGEKFIKGYRWAAEEVVLQRRLFDRNIYQIGRADELVLLFVRTILKIDFIWIAKRLFLIERQYFPAHILREYMFLSAALEVDEFDVACNDLLPEIDSKDIASGITNINRLTLFQIICWRMTLKNHLGYSRRLSIIQGWKAFFRAYFLFFLNKFGFYRKKKKQLYSGGRTIALLGADGAGKSTMIGELERWLGYYLDTRTIYVGTGDGKKGFLLTAFDSVFLHLGELRRKPKIADQGLQTRDHKNGDSSSRIANLAKNARATLIAVHRRSAIRYARRMANNGKLVLMDRFPQPFQRGYGDGPKINKREGQIESGLYNWEQVVYDQMFNNFPDCCIVLLVDPQVSVERKPENELNTIIRKNQVLSEIVARKGARTYVLDANLGYDAVLSQLKSRVWSLL